MDVRPGQTILEIGGGNGAAASVLCERMKGRGRLVSIDRSATATRRAGARNAAHVTAGRADFRTVALAAFEPVEPFDAAVAMNVNAFWTGPADPEWDVLDRALRPSGAGLFLFYGYGRGDPTGARDVTGLVGDAMRRRGYAVQTAASPEIGCLAIIGRR